MLKFYNKNSQPLKTDLASEMIKTKRTPWAEQVDISEIVVDEKRARLIGKNCGRYVTVDSPLVRDFRADGYFRLVGALKSVFSGFVKGERIMVVGLGNEELASDSLGVKVAKGVDVFQDGRVFCVCPSVFGKTGIESADVIEGVVKQVKPDCVVAFDSLCAGDLSRVFTSFQFTDAGITPGSGVGNHRKELSRTTLGVEVVGVGVPTVVYASTIAGDSVSGDMIVTGKDIEMHVHELALVLSSALNECVKEL